MKIYKRNYVIQKKTYQIILYNTFLIIKIKEIFFYI